MTMSEAPARPIRLRLSRGKGFNLQKASMVANGLPAVTVARPSKWGNPFKIGKYRNYAAADAVRDFRLWHVRSPTVRSCERLYGKPPDLTSLRGKNLACWCPPDQPCHADVLLEIANA